MSHDLFNLHCGELIPRHLVGAEAFRIGVENITNIRYADDTVLIAESQSDLQRLLDMVMEESAKRPPSDYTLCASRFSCANFVNSGRRSIKAGSSSAG